MLISEPKIFHRQFFFKNLLISHFTQWALACNDFIQPELETTSWSCFCAANLQENSYAEARSNFIETTLQHECFPEGLLHLFRAILNRSTPEGLPLQNRFKTGLRRDVNVPPDEIKTNPDINQHSYSTLIQNKKRSYYNALQFLTT